MTGPSTDDLIHELQLWAPRERAGNTEDAELVLRLLLDHVTADPAELAPGDLDELLLETFPSLVTVLAPDELDGVVPSTRDLLTFLTDTGRLTADLAEPLRRELDGVEPRFVAAVMDPDNWGETRRVTQEMAADGVDVTDESAVVAWLAEHHPEALAEQPESLAEALGLPERLPALRLPPEAELAADARRSGLLRQATELAAWVGGGRTVTEDDLDRDDALAVAGVLGLAVPAGFAGMADLPDLVRLWDLAVAAGLVTVEDGTARGVADAWPTGADDDLDAWALGFDATVGGLALDAELTGEEDLDFEGAGAVTLALFLDRATGVPRADLAELVRDDATDDLDEPDEAWTRWVTAHGDPAEALLTRLADHGAVIGDDVVHLTPLGLWAMWDQLTEGGIEIPLLPPPAEMTAADLLAAAEGLPEEQLDQEIGEWLAARGAAATGELLDAAADGEPADRLFAVSVVTGLGPAEPQWMAALARPELRAYARVALDGDLTVDDIAWLLTDLLAVTEDDSDLDAEFREAVPPGLEHDVIDVMWRMDHPHVGDVLTMLGEHHPDKQLAKAARKAAFKASSRQS